MENSLKRQDFPQKKTRFTGNLLLILLLAVQVACTLDANKPENTSANATQSVVEYQPTHTNTPIPEGYVAYTIQSGDYLPAVAKRFGVWPAQIKSDGPHPVEGLLTPGQLLYVPDVLDATTSDEWLIPDGDIVFSPSAVDFDMQQYVEQAGGRLSTHKELMTRGTTPAWDIVYQLALENSVNPRILLSLMEFHGQWVSSASQTSEQMDYPMAYEHPDRKGIYRQTGWAIRQLQAGYYGWREGSLTELTFKDGFVLRLSPYLNSGTVAVMYTFAQTMDYQTWKSVLYGDDSFVKAHTILFGDAWQREEQFGPIFPAGTVQPELQLPFSDGEVWNYTCGPHSAWGKYGEGPPAALDFAPPLFQSGCGVSNRWALATAAGLVVRTGNGVVVLDLDGDGYEQTGWVLVYMHISPTSSVKQGEWVEADGRIGHPSCAGGSATGIHQHITRKFNGEWVLAEGGLPFVLSGYRAYKSEKWCEGTLVRGDDVVYAFAWGNYLTKISRPELESFPTIPQIAE